MAQCIVRRGALLGFQGAKPLFRPVLAQAVSSLPVEPYDAVQSEKGLMKQARSTRQLSARDLLFLNSFLMFIYKLQMLNSCNEYLNIKLMLCQSMNLIQKFYLNDNFHI